MKNKKIFSNLMLVLASIVVLILIYKGINRGSNINQGKFRVVDTILSCTADIMSNTAENSAMSFTADQRNNLAFLIQSADSVSIEKITIKDIKTNKKSDKLYIYQKGKAKNPLSSTRTMNIDWNISETNQILIEIEVLNEKVVNNYIINDEATILKHDATALLVSGTRYEDLRFKVSFKIEIKENNGKINELKVDLTLPKQEILAKGNYVERMNLEEFVFKVK